MSNKLIKNTIYNYYKRFNEGINFNDLDDSSEDEFEIIETTVIQKLFINAVNDYLHIMHTPELKTGKNIIEACNKIRNIYNSCTDKHILDKIYKVQKDDFMELLTIGLQIFEHISYLNWMDIYEVGNRENDIEKHMLYYTYAPIISNDMFQYPEGTETVDLLLPSHLLWTIKNIGADDIFVPGKYFQWGDTEGVKDLLDCRSDRKTLRNKEIHVDIDHCNIPEKSCKKLMPDNDTATVLLGPDYRMPTEKEFNELLDNTIGIHLYLDSSIILISKKDITKYIILPSTGYYKKIGDTLLWEGFPNIGHYWASEKDHKYEEAVYLYFKNEHIFVDLWAPTYFLVIRAVKEL